MLGRIPDAIILVVIGVVALLAAHSAAQIADTTSAVASIVLRIIAVIDSVVAIDILRGGPMLRWVSNRMSDRSNDI